MPTETKTFWSPRAKQDLRDIWCWYAQIASPAIADRIFRDLATAACSLIQNPDRGTKRTDLAPSVRAVLNRPHIIYFRTAGTQAQIIRVLRENRDPFPALPHVGT
ncbi:MAG: type II toxin-antitoxin system RelE/ParE family toxin [Beijerinckiaceae bacterium]